MVANMESERIGERTASVKEHLRAQGRFVGGEVPFGYEKTEDGALTRRTDFEELRMRILDMSQGGKSTRAIAQTLTDEGMPVSHNTIYRLLDGRRKTDSVTTR
jgi:DNA invertase Pin-like site-specific DNA recombinase